MKQYVVDAFTDQVFHGNQAAVCVLDAWLPEELMMNITRENNFSETAFTVREGEKWHLRWFTPGGEIDLCGHATLGTAFVLLNYYETEARQVVFTTLSGDLIVARKGELYEMEFPAYDLKRVDVTAAMEDALGASVKEAYLARDLLCVLEDEQTVRDLTPDLEKIKQIDGLLVHVTARGKDEDCVSRSFAPKLSVAEDPVCGSGHCHIIPYWADQLGRNELVAEILTNFADLYLHENPLEYVEEYRKRSFVIGKDINVISSRSTKRAHALAINDDCSLQVRFEDGNEMTADKLYQLSSTTA